MEKTIFQAQVCPYCGNTPKLVDSIEIYKTQSFGMVYLCKPCDAWVGVRKGTTISLGRLAKKDLRDKKKRAHIYFENLWKRKMLNGFSRADALKSANFWLSQQMNIPLKHCHIGFMDDEQCDEMITLCKKYYVPINEIKSRQK